jgi:hypothetical protein
MTETIQTKLDDLRALRLPDLQARFAELVGEETRCPNKAFLLRRIGEALEARAAQATPTEDVTAEAATSTDEAPAPEEVADDTPQTDAPAPNDALVDDVQDAKPDGARLQDLDVEQLRARYLDVVGRGTGSHDKRYLIWKIRQAQQGKVPVGPVGRRQPGEPPVEHKVLPLRMPAETVEALDDVWRRRGLKSRMDLFRHALDQYLTGLGEEAAATRVRSA